MAYPKTINFNGSDNRVIVNVMPGGRFSAIDPDQPQDGEALIWGLGDTEMSAIADLQRQLDEAL
jgi:hypothetical protein